MARNDQVTRQWHLLRRLEGSAGLTLEELGEGLPEDSRRHLRTVRRDLEALESVGFPMVTERVAGQTRWKLMDGFRRVPALGFAPLELMALVFSRDLLGPLQGTHIQAALDSALTAAPCRSATSRRRAARRAAARAIPTISGTRRVASI